MPSPFPGMDPWLEDPTLFGGLHGSTITLIKMDLQARLPDAYYADSSDRVFVDLSERYREPDVNLLRRTSPSAKPGHGGPTVATRTPPIVIQPIPYANDERRESFVNVYTRRDGDEQLVTSIEILSPTNKTTGEGMGAYRYKQSDMLLGGVNTVEIDLLRGGKHVTVVPLEVLRVWAGDYDYHVCVSRADRRREAEVYPFLLPARLPEIAIPLLPGEGTVALDLQPIFDRSYDAGPYRKRVHYMTDQPVPQLRPDQAEWATRVLREQGVLPPA